MLTFGEKLGKESKRASKHRKGRSLHVEPHAFGHAGAAGPVLQQSIINQIIPMMCKIFLDFISQVCQEGTCHTKLFHYSFIPVVCSTMIAASLLACAPPWPRRACGRSAEMILHEPFCKKTRAEAAGTNCQMIAEERAREQSHSACALDTSDESSLQEEKQIISCMLECGGFLWGGPG